MELGFLANFWRSRRRCLTCSQCPRSSQRCLRACETCVLWEQQCQADSAKDVVIYAAQSKLLLSNLDLTAGNGDGGAGGEAGDDGLGDEVDEEAEPEVAADEDDVEDEEDEEEEDDEDE